MKRTNLLSCLLQDGRERLDEYPHVLRLTRGRRFPRLLQHHGRVVIDLKTGKCCFRIDSEFIY